MEKRNYIAELLEQHDCVIIPGLGGFVGSYAPAVIHPVYHTFQPPYKKILFNINLRQNDGLLANHIAQAEKVSYADANEKVWLYSQECQRLLSTRKQILVSNVGRLFMGHEGHNPFRPGYPLQSPFGVISGSSPFSLYRSEKTTAIIT